MHERSMLGTSHGLGNDLAIPVTCPAISDSWDAVLNSAGLQSGSPRDVPLWHGNYFELKPMETLQAHQELNSPPQ